MSELKFITAGLNSTKYIETIDEQINKVCDTNCRECTKQQNFANKKRRALKWPFKSVIDLNIIKNRCHLFNKEIFRACHLLDKRFRFKIKN